MKIVDLAVLAKPLCKSALLTTLLAAALVSCKDGRQRPLPPQSPPVPKAAAEMPANVQPAVFTYSRGSAANGANTDSKRNLHHVIRT